MKPEKLSSEIVKPLLERHSGEMHAFYQYNAMSNFLNDQGFFKAAKFFAGESKDELEHAHKIEKYITDWNVLPQLGAVEKPAITFNGLVDFLEQAYKLELEFYEAYEKLSGEMLQVDICTFDFLQFFRQVQNDSVIEYSDKINLCQGVDVKSKFEMLMIEDKLFS
jgi:ferritin